MKKKLFCLLFALTFLVAALVPVSGFAADDTLVPVSSFVSGEEYVLAISGINDYRGPFGEACVTGEEESEYGLGYALRPKTLTAAKNCLWRITQKDNGKMTLYSTAAKQYLNMEADKASLSDQEQELDAILNGSKLTIYTEVNGTKYYLRFTNMYKTYSCWHAGTGASSNSFTLYSTRDVAEVKEYDNAGQTPVFSVACFADLHVDYGIQSWKVPIRKGTIDAVKKLQSLGGADVILVGGDILSQNDRTQMWTDDLVQKAQKTVYETLMDGSKEWIVLPVTGNHDSEAGVAAGDTAYSGDWTPFLNDWVGEFDAACWNETSEYKELLGYRYNLGGIDFICINTPYLSQRSSGLYADQSEWLEEQLEEIGKDKTVIVTSHYPVVHGKYPMGSLGGGDARAKFEAVLKKYPNVLYCYGHVHEGDGEYAWYSAGELIRPSGTSTLNEDNSYSTTGYINCHMGSMGYYNNQFQPGGLLADEPQIVQFMKMDFYADHITFNFYNTGEKSGDPNVYEIASYTIRRDMAEQLGVEAPAGDSTDTSENNTDSNQDATVGQTEGDATSTASDSGESQGTSLGLVIGLCAGAVVLAAVAGFLVIFLKKK